MRESPKSPDIGAVRKLLMLVTFCATLLFPMASRAAWNPLQAIADAGRAVLSGVKAVGGAIGGVIGAPFGGLVNSLATPTIETAESSGHRLIQDVNDKLGQQIDHVDAAAKDVVSFAGDQIDKKIAVRIDQVNGDLSARIVQVTSSGDFLIGRVDEVARNRIDQAFSRIEGTEQIVNADVRNRLDQIDVIVERRTVQVQSAVAASIAQVDDAVAKRLEQADEIIGKRIGSVDVVITKQAINAEGSILRIGALLAAVAFVAFALWRFWREVSPHVPVPKDRMESGRFEALSRVKTGLQIAWKPLAWQIGMAAVCVAVLFGLSIVVTVGPRGRAKDLVAFHEKALTAAASALDLTAVRYHAAQLQFLDSDEKQERHHHAVAIKAELMRAVFTRPTLLQSTGGVRELMARVDEVEKAMSAQSDKAADESDDPDLKTIKAHILWQVGTMRSAEREAATLCAMALKQARQNPQLDFQLRPLAEHYVRIVAKEHVPPEMASELSNALQDQKWQSSAFPQLQHLFSFDTAVQRLEQRASPAFVALIEAHAESLRSAGQERKQALAQRTQRAREVVAAWQAFDETLQTDPWVATSNLVFRSFKLNDAQLSHALWYAENGSTTELPPLLMQSESRSSQTEPNGKHPVRAAPPAAPTLTALQRVRLAPVRVAWFNRYAPLLSDPARRLLAYQEAQRFRLLEQRTHEFEATTVAYLNSVRSPGPKSKDALRRMRDMMESAAASAASLRLYSSSGGNFLPYGEVLEQTYVDMAGPAAAGKDQTAVEQTSRAVRASYDLRGLTYASL
jgi:hypothetical protein